MKTSHAKRKRALVAGVALAASLLGLCREGHAQQAGEIQQRITAEVDAKSCAPANGKNVSGRRIFYGEPAPNERSVVGISFRQAGKPYICTGVRISTSAVLTAGHCSCGIDYELRFGESMHAPDVVLPVHRVASHPGFDCRRHLENQPGVDYAVMTFHSNGLPTDYSQRALPVTFMTPNAARQSVLKPNSSLYVVGYGLTEKLETGFRLGAEIPVLSWDCAEHWAQARGCQPFSEIVLSELGQLGFRPDGRNRDSCGGDSGGPAFAVSLEMDECTGRPIQKTYLIAITSRGMRLNRGESSNKICGGGGIYEIVARHSLIKWFRGLGIDVSVEQRQSARD